MNGETCTPVNRVNRVNFHRFVSFSRVVSHSHVAIVDTRQALERREKLSRIPYAADSAAGGRLEASRIGSNSCDSVLSVSVRAGREGG